MNSAAMKIGVHVSFSIMILSKYMLGSGIAGSYGNSVSSLLRTLHTVLHSDCTKLDSHRQYRKVPFFPHPLWHLLFVVFNDGHFDQCEVVPYCSFDLHFSNN